MLARCSLFPLRIDMNFLWRRKLILTLSSHSSKHQRHKSWQTNDNDFHSIYKTNDNTASAWMINNDQLFITNRDGVWAGSLHLTG